MYFDPQILFCKKRKITGYGIRLLYIYFGKIKKWHAFFKQFGLLDSVVGPRAKMRASKMMHIFYLILFLMENEVKRKIIYCHLISKTKFI